MKTNCEMCGHELEVYECSRTESSNTVPHRPSQCIAFLLAELETAKARAESAELRCDEMTKWVQVNQVRPFVNQCESLRAEVEKERARADKAESAGAMRLELMHLAQERESRLRASVTRLQEEVEILRDAIQAELAQRGIDDSYGRDKSACQTVSDILERRGADFSLQAALAITATASPTGAECSEQQTSENKALERGRSADLSPGGGSEEPGNPNIAKRECGCEASIADGFLYKTCDQHVTSNPCFPYWDWEAQQRALDRQKAPHSAGASDEAERGTIERLMDIAARASISSDPDAWANGVNECCDMIRARDRATRLAAIEEERALIAKWLRGCTRRDCVDQNRAASIENGEHAKWADRALASKAPGAK